ncbi:MAG: nucleotide sugar dehydrogenase, partial [Deltaproteobacteria bacterium]|nr:nucleotide sugar dehydrogenase [Deltaproteobacteria bacterium]
IAGRDFYLAFSPERIDPGNRRYGVENTPKIVGGATGKCTKKVCGIYSKAIKDVYPVSSTDVAEMVKLLENTFRAVNIALVNEIAIMCHRLGVDTWEVIEAAGTKPFGFMPFYPGPGIGGHCIPVDPMYLSWKLKSLNYKARFIELADAVNSDMANFVVSMIMEALNSRKKCLNGSKILILGVSYKKDIEDIRESPAIEIIRTLRGNGAKVIYHDPFVPSLKTDSLDMKSVALSKGLDESDCAVIITDHTSVDYGAVAEKAGLIVDTRNAIRDPARYGGKIFRL